MSTLENYEKTKTQLDAWLKEIFETPEKIIGNFSWEPNFFQSSLFVGENYPFLINQLVLGKYAETELGEIKSKILGVYVTKPDISGIKLGNLNNEERDLLKEEIKNHYDPKKREIEPYKILLIKLKHRYLSKLLIWIYNIIEKIEK